MPCRRTDRSKAGGLDSMDGSWTPWGLAIWRVRRWDRSCHLSVGGRGNERGVQRLGRHWARSCRRPIDCGGDHSLSDPLPAHARLPVPPPHSAKATKQRRNRDWGRRNGSRGRAEPSRGQDVTVLLAASSGMRCGAGGCDRTVWRMGPAGRGRKLLVVAVVIDRSWAG